MSQGARAKVKVKESVYDAWRANNEMQLIGAVIAKYAKIIDECESARDMKPLASGMFEAIDRLNQVKAAHTSNAQTPLAAIVAMAERKAASGE